MLPEGNYCICWWTATRRAHLGPERSRHEVQLMMLLVMMMLAGDGSRCRWSSVAAC